MSAARNTVRIKPKRGEPFCYQVESWSEKKSNHEVDLLAYNGSGECDCIDWSTTCHINWQTNGGKIVPYGTVKHKDPARTSCRHIEAARRYLLNSVIQEGRKSLGRTD